MHVLLSGFIGLLTGRLSVLWAASLAEPGRAAVITRCRHCDSHRSIHSLLFRIPPKCSDCGTPSAAWTWLATLVPGLLFSLYAWLLVDADCQTVTEVRPATALLYSRLPFHLLFIWLLFTAVLTDLLDYVIPDQITISGILLAASLAAISGELQMIHIWVDWSDDLVALYGPYLPQCIKDHQHLHGLALSLSGGAACASLMWLARVAAQRILGFPTIGFGDVTLMAMIGCFMGWQPVLCVLAVAPLIGLVLGLMTFVLTGRSFVAFGPYLCAAACLILCTWREIWEVQGLRIVFGHWPSLATLLAGSLILFCVLLWAVRVFRATPASRLR